MNAKKRLSHTFTHTVNNEQKAIKYMKLQLNGKRNKSQKLKQNEEKQNGDVQQFDDAKRC